MKIVVNYCDIINWNLLNYLTSTKKCCVTYYCHTNYLKFLAVVHVHIFFCSHEITEDSNANQTSQTDLEKENFNEKDNDEETMLVSMFLKPELHIDKKKKNLDVANCIT